MKQFSKSLLFYISILISVGILLFNGTVGYFVLTARYGDPTGVYLFVSLSVFAILSSFNPLLWKARNYHFYNRIFLYSNVVVAFYPLLYQAIAQYIISRLL